MGESFETQWNVIDTSVPEVQFCFRALEGIEHKEQLRLSQTPNNNVCLWDYCLLWDKEEICQFAPTVYGDV